MLTIAIVLCTCLGLNIWFIEQSCRGQDAHQG